jgi:hypothetical protein
MTAATKEQQFLVPNANQGTGRHAFSHVLNGMPSATLGIPGAGTYYFDCSGILKPGLLNMGILVQPHGAPLTISYTLADRDQVMKDPDSVPWTTEPPVANQDIVSSGQHVPAVIRMVATTNMVVYVAAC